MLAVAFAVLAAPRPLVVAYVPNWNDLAAFARTIDYGRLTQIDLAFENPIDERGNLSFNPADRVLVAKAHAKGVKVLISIGGGSASETPASLDRYARLLGPARRDGFVRKLVEYVVAHGFDGLDVDLEGRAIIPDYGPFVTALGRALRARGRLMTAALSKGNGGPQVSAEALAAFDFVNLMAYDATGPWVPGQPGQHASMAFAKESVDYWLGRGLPRSKAVLGVPFYGYGFGKDALGDEWSYRKILAKYPGAEGVDQVGKTIWYNGVPTIRAKAKYILDERLAGAMVWSLDSDAPGEHSLLRALGDALAARR